MSPLTDEVTVRIADPSPALSDAVREPQNWLTYNGSYASTHYSTLDQIRSDNVSALELKWVWQANSLEKIEATPLVVDGVMYLTDPPNDVVAVDGQTGRVFWRYQYVLPAGPLLWPGESRARHPRQ